LSGMVAGEILTKADRAPRQTPKYLPVYRRLRERLEGGDLKPGSLLPTEDELCSRYRVSRYTLREALGLLERQGYIQRRRRAGTRILARPASGVFRAAISSRRDLFDFVKDTALEFGTPRLIETDGQLARLLGCDELRLWHLCEGVRVDLPRRRPISVTQVYVDARFSIPPDGDFRGQPVFHWVEQHHDVKAAAVSQDITAVLLAAMQAEIFGERVGDPALRIVRRYFDRDQRIFVITVTTHRSKDFIYNMRLQLDASGA